MTTTFLDDRVVLHAGDCREVIAKLPSASVDSIVCDPPYSLVSIVKGFGKDGSAPAKSGGATGVYGRASAGFMGKQWDTGETAFDPEFWELALRVLKPGGHLVAFSGTRTYHRLACAIEDAGFEIRDQVAWCYGSGFPKSHDVAKALDKSAGITPQIVPKGDPVKRIIPGADQNKVGWIKDNGRTYQPGEYVPTTAEAQQWSGWGTALKPAWEPICLARKPLIGSVASNVLAHGVGALNIDRCRVEVSDVSYARNCSGDRGHDDNRKRAMTFAMTAGSANSAGRFPANLIHDGSDEVLAGFPTDAGACAPVRGTELSDVVADIYGNRARVVGAFHADSGSAARFFYTAKADSEDRIASKHPTIKPVDLMQWLVRLVTPKGGVVLDPFAGTGTTGEAAWREGMRAILIEREAEYQADIARRMDLAAKPTKRAAVAKTKGKIDADAGPLFGGVS